jgi:hypothetical protein
LGNAEARRFNQVTYRAESAFGIDPIESTVSGATTPPMNPTFHARGGGVALSDATAHPPESAIAGRSAV